MRNETQDRSKRKSRRLLPTLLVLALAAAGVGPVWAQATGETRRVEGRVIQIRHGIETAGSETGTMDRIMLQTRDRQRLEVTVPAGSLGQQVRVGDRVRAQVRAMDGQGTALEARTLQVRRTGQTLRFGEGSGAMGSTGGVAGATGAHSPGNCAQDPASCGSGGMGQGVHDGTGPVGSGPHQGGAGSHGGMGAGSGAGMGAGRGGAAGSCPRR
ncbi:MAG: hypothetical protein Q9Q40_11965 [Acidobacteriota bacterium]|nr:hypothetical protein [Acidobacteriota bacterium]